MRRVIFCADPVDEAGGQQRADQQQGDPQSADENPFADVAVPEVMPASGERIRQESVVAEAYEVVVQSSSFRLRHRIPGLEEPVDVPIQYRRRIADLVLGRRSLTIW